MVISNIIGGLGNQMFQYAAGRSLSLDKDLPFYLDLSDYDKYTLHNGYELSKIFNLSNRVAFPSEIKNVLGWQKHKFIRRVLTNKQFSFIRKKSLICDDENFARNVSSGFFFYLSGFWQSEIYFNKFSNRIREDFTFKDPEDKNNISLSESIRVNQSVSIHIRRGDYISDSRTSKIHGVCSLDYYQNSISHIVRHIANPHFFIFSDDLHWARNNLKIKAPHSFVDFNFGVNSFMDMRLMSLCKHNIIANSTFSWWGAWLNANPNKIVIAPNNWFINKAPQQNLIPRTWHIF